uniref:Uncharacterized protein n=1 Tax=Aegilops tauschii subsp. strangulata TaxID=200361 RepID=A0A453RER1_AEGTS
MNCSASAETRATIPPQLPPIHQIRTLLLFAPLTPPPRRRTSPAAASHRRVDPCSTSSRLPPAPSSTRLGGAPLPPSSTRLGGAPLPPSSTYLGGAWAPGDGGGAPSPAPPPAHKGGLRPMPERLHPPPSPLLQFATGQNGGERPTAADLFPASSDAGAQRLMPLYPAGSRQATDGAGIPARRGTEGRRRAKGSEQIR